MCIVKGPSAADSIHCFVCKLTNAQQCDHERASCPRGPNHPRFDVVYYKKAGLRVFEGCGFCKWANKTHPAKNESSAANRGWPGCCFPPTTKEFAFIAFEEWPIVARYHEIRCPNAVLKQPTPTATSFSNQIPRPTISRVQSSTKTAGKDRERERLNLDVVQQAQRGTAYKPKSPVNASYQPPSTSPSVAVPTSSAANSRDRTPPRSISSGSSNSPPNGTSHMQQQRRSRDDPNYVRPPTAEGNYVRGTTPTKERHSPVDRERRRDREGGSREHSQTRKTSPVNTRPSSSQQIPAPATYSRATGPPPPAFFNSAAAMRKVGPYMDNTGAVNAATSTTLPRVAMTRQNQHPSISSIMSGHQPRIPAARPINPPPPSVYSVSSGSSVSSARDGTATSEGFTDYLSEESDRELEKVARTNEAMIYAATLRQYEELEFRSAREHLAALSV